MQKRITYNRDNHDFDMFLDDAYQGSRARHIEAEVELDRIAYDAATHTAGPLDMAVEGALERLAEESAGAMRLARADKDKAGGTFWQRAATSYTNALIEYRKGVRPELLASGAWLLPSRRAGEAPHIVRMDGDWICSCKAGAAMHWSIALIIGCEVAQDAMQQFDDGPLDDDADLVAQAAPLIDALDTLIDCDQDADGDEPMRWRIGAVMAARVACDPPNEPNPLGDEEGDSEPPDRPRAPLWDRIAAARRGTYAYAA